MRSLDVRTLESQRARTDCLAAVRSFRAPRFDTDEDLSTEALTSLFAEQLGSSSAIVAIRKRRVDAEALNFQACSAAPDADSKLSRNDQGLLFLTLAFMRPDTANEETSQLEWFVEGASIDAFGNHVIRARQSLAGVPITSTTAAVVISPEGIVQSVTARPVLARELTSLVGITSEKISEQLALSYAKNRLSEDSEPIARGEILFRGPDGLRPAWRFLFEQTDPFRTSRMSVTVDRVSGRTLELSNVLDSDMERFAAAPDLGRGLGNREGRVFPTDCSPPPCRTTATRDYNIPVGSQMEMRRVTVTAGLVQSDGQARPLTSQTPDEFDSADMWYRATVDAYANVWAAMDALHRDFKLLPAAVDRLDTLVEIIVDSKRQIPASLTAGKIYLGRLPAAGPAASDQDIVAHEFVHYLINERRRATAGGVMLSGYNCTNPSHVQFPSIDESLADVIGTILGARARTVARIPDSIGVFALGERARNLKDPTKSSKFNRNSLESAYKQGDGRFQSALQSQSYAQPMKLVDVISIPCRDNKNDFEQLVYLNTGPLNTLAYKLLNKFPQQDRPPNHRTDEAFLQLVGGVYLSVGEKITCDGAEDCDDFCSFTSKLTNGFYNPLSPHGQKFVRKLEEFLKTEGLRCT